MTSITPLRRGVLAKTNASFTRWIKFFYQRKPHNLCPKCFIIKHTKGACSAATEYLVKAHNNPYFLGANNVAVKKKVGERKVVGTVPNFQKKKLV